MRLSGRKSSPVTRRWAEQQRVILVTLIGLNVTIFVAQLFIENYQPDFIRAYLGISDHGVRDAFAWQFLTAMFLHDGAWAFGANMLALYLLGRDLESILGQRHFLYLYLAGAVGGELGHLFSMPSDTVLLAGAGGVAAVVVAYATVLPELELTSVFSILPLRIKAKHLVCALLIVAAVLFVTKRNGVVGHSAVAGGCAAGWLYAHLLGFGRTLFLQRIVHKRRLEAERLHRMSAEEFISEEIDPLLDKISRNGIESLTRAERRTLARAREKMAEQN